MHDLTKFTYRYTYTRIKDVKTIKLTHTGTEQGFKQIHAHYRLGTTAQ